MKIISGGQTGADLAGLKVGKDLGFETGGWAPKNWKTSIGSMKLQLQSFNLKESKEGYKGRTWENVRNSNATIRLAVNLNSTGERCTLNAIKHFKKPYFDIDLLKPKSIQECLEFLISHIPDVLNIAGNTQFTESYDIEQMTYNYLRTLLSEYKRIYLKKYK